MLGVLDSGEGGENAVEELRLLCPSLDILLLKDRKNSPYGTKSRPDLIRITRTGAQPDSVARKVDTSISSR